MNIHKKVLILLFAVFGGCAVNAYGGVHWDKFLKQPDKESLVELEDALSESAQRCSWGNPGNRDVVSIETGQKLFNLIGKGNGFSFRVGLLVVRCFDGGELEDFHRSAGLFFEVQPHLFLKIVKEKGVPESDIKYMLTMLPMDTVDDIDRAIVVVENRIAILEVISGDRFEDIKKAGLSFLKEQKETLNRTRRAQ